MHLSQIHPAYRLRVVSSSDADSARPESCQRGHTPHGAMSSDKMLCRLTLFLLGRTLASWCAMNSGPPRALVALCAFSREHKTHAWHLCVPSDHICGGGTKSSRISDRTYSTRTAFRAVATGLMQSTSAAELRSSISTYGTNVNAHALILLDLYAPPRLIAMWSQVVVDGALRQ